MGHYLTLATEVASNRLDATILLPAFESTFFLPVAVGAIEGQHKGDKFFASGFALEHFLSLFISGRRRPVAVTVASAPEADARSYLQSVASRISRWDAPTDVTSEFETIDPALGATFIDSRRVDQSSLEELSDWLARFPLGKVFVYGTVDLAAVEQCPSYARAFRTLHRTEDGHSVLDDPILYLSVMRDPLSANVIDVRVRANSGVWLREARALSGRVGPDEAEVNLQRLAVFARSVLRVGTGVRVTMEGSEFFRESDRLKRTLDASE